MKKKQTIKELKAELAQWKELAERRGDILSATRAEYASLQDSYHLLNEAVAKVMKSAGGEKRRG